MGGQVFTTDIKGFEGTLYPVEVSIQRGLPSFKILGLPSTKAIELKEKVYAAFRASGLQFPRGRVRVSVKGSLFYVGLGLPIALSIYMKGIKSRSPNIMAWGEIKLDGSVTTTAGVFQALECSKQMRAILPYEAKDTVGYFPQIEACAVNDLRSAINAIIAPQKYITKGMKPSQEFRNKGLVKRLTDELNSIVGQQEAMRAIQISLAGGHSLLIEGSIGTGKTMLPMAISDFSSGFFKERARIESVNINKIGDKAIAAPGITPTALFTNAKRDIPGIVPLASYKTLLIDEIPLHSPTVRAKMAEVLESKYVGGYPLATTIIFTGNLCPCGQRDKDNDKCTCKSNEVARYRARISPQLRNRIDLHIVTNKFVGKAPVDPIKDFFGNIHKAIAIQRKRYKVGKVPLNGLIEDAILHKKLIHSGDNNNLLETLIMKLELNGRDINRVIRVSRTIADLEGQTKVNENHIYEALSYRPF